MVFNKRRVFLMFPLLVETFHYCCMDRLPVFCFLLCKVSWVYIALGAILQCQKIGNLGSQLYFKLLNNMDQYVPENAVEFI